MSERPEMSDEIRRATGAGRGDSGRPTERLCTLALAVGLLGLFACAKPWSDQSSTSTEVAETSEPSGLEFDEWVKGSLHCAVQLCATEYPLRVSEPGRVRVEIYAPLDSGGPDFALTVVDESGDEIARPVDDDARPRRVVFEANVGTYTLHVTSRGSNEDLLRYEVVAFFTPGPGPGRRVPPPVQPVVRPAPIESGSKPATTTSVPADPSSTTVFVRAEVLDVESEAGGARFVLLDKGLPSGLREKMRGALLDDGDSIGRFEIVEVYEDGCRARIDGDLTREVGIDTVAEIYR